MPKCESLTLTRCPLQRARQCVLLPHVEEWIDIRKDAAHVSRERARARDLRRSTWWQNRIRAGICHYCGQQVGRDKLTMDHVVPVARGGRSTRGNVVPSCEGCNRTKKHYTPAEQLLDALERQAQAGGNR